MSRRLVLFLVSAALTTGAAALVAPVAEPPDSLGNTVSGAIETADTPWSGTSYDVRHVINPGGGRPLIIKVLTTDTRDDLGPRLAVNPVNGDSWVAWWRHGSIDQVIVRRRINATGAWTAEAVQSASTESSRHPSIAFEGSRGWIAFEVGNAGGGTLLEAKVIEDDPAPFVAATVVATTSYTRSRCAHPRGVRPGVAELGEQRDRSRVVPFQLIDFDLGRSPIRVVRPRFRGRGTWPDPLDGPGELTETGGRCL